MQFAHPFTKMGAEEGRDSQISKSHFFVNDYRVESEGDMAEDSVE